MVTCDRCGKLIKRSKSQLAREKHHYCSKECQYGQKQSPSPEKIIGLFRGGLTAEEIAAECGLSRSGVVYWLHKCLSIDERQRLKRAHLSKAKEKICCSYCGKEIERLPKKIHAHNFCSRKCADLYRRKANREQVIKLYLTGETINSIAAKLKISRATAARILSLELEAQLYQRQKALNHKKFSVKAAIASGYHGPRGERHPWWKGGITPIQKIIRSSPNYKSWRVSVFERDNFVCQKCGERGGRLNAHHIKPFAQNPAGRMSLENGITLCEKCHREEHRKRGNFNVVTRGTARERAISASTRIT